MILLDVNNIVNKYLYHYKYLIRIYKTLTYLSCFFIKIVNKIITYTQYTLYTIYYTIIQYYTRYK